MPDSDSIVSKPFREISALLQSKFGAQGSGLVEMTRSIESKLPRTLIAAIQRIGRTRNRVIHEGEALRNSQQFSLECERVLADLTEIGRWREQDDEGTPAGEGQNESQRTKVLRELIDDPNRLIWYACDKCKGTGRDDIHVSVDAVLVMYCPYCVEGRMLLPCSTDDTN